jgi:hypothetical protein
VIADVEMLLPAPTSLLVVDLQLVVVLLAAELLVEMLVQQDAARRSLMLSEL